MVVLKVVKHAHESPDTTGILLGLEQSSHIEVTNCFPLLPDAEERRQDKYTSEMLKLLREVKIDNFNIGWYQSSPLNSFCTDEFVEIQHGYQQETEGAVALIYDPTSASLGSLYLKVGDSSCLQRAFFVLGVARITFFLLDMTGRENPAILRALRQCSQSMHVP